MEFRCISKMYGPDFSFEFVPIFGSMSLCYEFRGLFLTNLCKKTRALWVVVSIMPKMFNHRKTNSFDGSKRVPRTILNHRPDRPAARVIRV